MTGRRGSVSATVLVTSTAGVAVAAVGVEVLTLLQSLTSGLQVVDVLGGILSTLVLLLIGQVMALRRELTRTTVVAVRAEKDIGEILEDRDNAMARMAEVVTVTKQLQEEVLRLRDSRHDFHERVTSTIDDLRAEVIRLGAWRPRARRGDQT